MDGKLTIEELKEKIESLDRALDDLPLMKLRQEAGAELARLTCLRHGTDFGMPNLRQWRGL